MNSENLSSPQTGSRTLSPLRLTFKLSLRHINLK